MGTLQHLTWDGQRKDEKQIHDFIIPRGRLHGRNGLSIGLQDNGHAPSQKPGMHERAQDMGS